jgi:hypothetical protein
VLMGCESGFLLAVIILNGNTMGKLRIWNGIGDDGDPDGHLYVCARSRQNAVNLINRAAYRRITLETLDKFSGNCWGKAMEGIAPKPGVWIVRKDGDKPERLR